MRQSYFCTSSPGRKCKRQRYRAGPLGKVSREQRNQDSWILGFWFGWGLGGFGFFWVFVLLAKKIHNWLGSEWDLRGQTWVGLPEGRKP